MVYPKYSVLMSLYIKENPQYFRAALDSMIQQTVMPDEIVIVEDGPLTKDLYETLDEYENRYIDLIKRVKNETNLGLGKALNAGLKECRNDLVARMDTDDISKLDRCEKQLKVFMENPELSIVGTGIAEFEDAVDNIISIRSVPVGKEKISSYIKKRCPLNHMSVIFRKVDVEKVGGYQDWHYNEDYYLWIRMYEANMTFDNISENLVDVRVGKEMYQRRGGWKYFKSEAKLQKYMYKHKVIGFFTYCSNVVKRFIVQILLPNKLRGWVYKKFARKEC